MICALEKFRAGNVVSRTATPLGYQNLQIAEAAQLLKCLTRFSTIEVAINSITNGTFGVTTFAHPNKRAGFFFGQVEFSERG